MTVDDVRRVLEETNEEGQFNRTIAFIDAGDYRNAATQLSITKNLWVSSELCKGVTINSEQDVPDCQPFDKMTEALVKAAVKNEL